MAKKNVRALWAAKIEGKLKPKKGVDILLPGQGKPFRGIVLGIDPSVRGTGLAVVKIESHNSFHLLYSKTIKLKAKLSMHSCLAEISRAVTKALVDYPVEHVAIEAPVYVQNFRTAMVLGSARGAAITAAALRKLPIFEYPPLRIKQSVVGYGRASKEQVARQLAGLLGLKKPLPSDEADAAAAALCHAFTHREQR